LPVSKNPQYQAIRKTFQQALSRAQFKLEQCQETLRQVEESVMCAKGANLIDFEPLVQSMDALRKKLEDTEWTQTNALECLRRSTKTECMSKEI
jgi:tRNA A58 N-methylase Trm61